MTANTKLAKERGVEGNIPLINQLHKTIREVTESAILNEIDNTVMEHVFEELEYLLQSLWDFPQNNSYHRYYKEFLFKKLWWGRTFKCQQSGTEFVVPYEVFEGAFYSVGNRFIDVGRMSTEGECLYCRIGGDVIEVTEGDGIA